MEPRESKRSSAGGGGGSQPLGVSASASLASAGSATPSSHDGKVSGAEEGEGRRSQIGGAVLPRRSVGDSVGFAGLEYEDDDSLTHEDSPTRSASTRGGITSRQKMSLLSGRRSFTKTLSSAETLREVSPEDLSPEKLEEAIEVLQNANLLLKLENEVLEVKLRHENAELVAGPDRGPKGCDALEGSHRGTSPQQSERSLSGSKAPPAGATSAQAASGGSGDAVSSSTSRSCSKTATALSSSATTASPRAASSLLAPRLRIESLDKTPKMSVAQKIELAEEAIRLTIQRLQAARDRTAASSADLRALVEAMNVRLQETRLAARQFQQVCGADLGSERASADKFMRFLSGLIKSSEGTLERLRLKTTAMRTHYRRVRADLTVKRELGEALRPVDFEKIRIEIKEMGKKIDNKNMHLIDLKNISGSATGRLLAGKKRMVDLSRKLNDIRREIASKQAEISNMEKEEKKVLEDVLRADVTLNTIRLRMEKHTVPDLLHYVRVKEELDTLRKDLVVWERRGKIQMQTERDLVRALRASGAGGTLGTAAAAPTEAQAQDATGPTSDTSTTTSSPSSATMSPRRKGRGRGRGRVRGSSGKRRRVQLRSASPSATDSAASSLSSASVT